MSSGILNPNKPIRICLIQSNPVWGACEEHLALLAEGLDPERFESVVLYPDCEPLREGFSRLPRPVIRRPLDPVLFSSIPKGHSRLTAVLRELDPQIVHCNDPGLAAMAAAQRLPSAKKILTFHTPSQPFGYRPWAAWLHRHLIRSGWEVVVFTDSNRRVVRQRYRIGDGRLHTIGSGIDPRRWTGAQAARGCQRSVWGVSDGQVVLLCAARLEPQKNHALLLTAYAALPEDVRAGTRLVLAGGGSLAGQLQELCVKLRIAGEVIFAGHQTRMHELFAAADIKILASHYEGMPFALMEAMASGLPVIATAVDGSRDAVVHGTNGLLTRPGSAEDLTCAMIRLTGSAEERARMGEQGKKIFEQKFTAARMAARFEELYASTAGQAAAPAGSGAA